MTDRNLMSRRSLMAGATIAATVGLGAAAAAQTKLSKADAKYQYAPKGQQRCEICLQFKPPNECQIVQSPIVPKGWCQFFAARDNAH